jgi:hypothetical protein
VCAHAYVRAHADVHERRDVIAWVGAGVRVRGSVG